MKDPIDQLVSLGGLALGPEVEALSEESSQMARLQQLLTKKNGFYAFHSALLVRPAGTSDVPLSLQRWNENGLWRECYEADTSKMLFFAEDLFGCQFALSGNNVVSFDPEPSEVKVIGDCLGDWAEKVLTDSEFLTGYPLAIQWRQANGELPAGYRLVPRKLFVLGGEFTIDNLMCVKDVWAMRSRGFFASHLRNLPDGGKVSFDLVD